MELSKTKVEQITNDSQIIEDYGEILSPKEIKKIIKKLFPSCEEQNGLLYGEYKGNKYCIFSKNISYLGIPHPIHKKRIQIPLNFKDVFYENKRKNIKTLLIGVYSYKNTLLFCDFDTSTYINNKSHNSSAHVYSIDLLNGMRNGYFSKIDIRHNMITVFNSDNIERYLNYKLFDEETGTVEVFDTLDDFFASIAKDWIGMDAYADMIENNYRNKYQPEWPGFYLEYQLEKYLNANDKTNVIKFYQDRTDGGVDLDLRFPQLGFYGDLKAHSSNSSAIQGNDYETIMKLLDNQVIYYVVANHDTEKDKDHGYVTTKYWNEEQNKDNIMSYSEKMKYSVHLNSYYVLELNKYNKKYIDVYNQGKNSDGHPRNPKISISMKNINNFIVHVVEFNDKDVNRD